MQWAGLRHYCRAISSVALPATRKTLSNQRVAVETGESKHRDSLAAQPPACIHTPYSRARRPGATNWECPVPASQLPPGTPSLALLVRSIPYSQALQ